MNYTVNDLYRGRKWHFTSRRAATSKAEQLETEWVEAGLKLVFYDLKPRVSQRDAQYGKLIYSTWRPDVWIPMLSIVEIPSTGGR